MDTQNAKLALELDRPLAAALARMDEGASGALMAGDIVWTHVNGRKTDNKEAVFEPWRSGKALTPRSCSATIWMERASIRMKSATTLDGMIVVSD